MDSKWYQKIIEPVIGAIITSIIAPILMRMTFEEKSLNIWVLAGVTILCAAVVFFVGMYLSRNCITLVSSPPPIKLHIFNGDKKKALQNAQITNIPITNNPENVLGTNENKPAFSAPLSNPNVPSKGVIRVRGTYEIHANDFGGGIPSAVLATTREGGIIYTQIPIDFKKRLKYPVKFSTKIAYDLNDVQSVELRVYHTGSWGLFFNGIEFKICKI